MLEILIANLIQIAQNDPDAFDLQQRQGLAVVGYMCDDQSDYESEDNLMSHQLDRVCELVWSELEMK